MVNQSRATMTAEEIRMQIGRSWREGQAFQEVRAPCRGDVVARSPVSSGKDSEDDLAAAHHARKVMAALPGFERAAILSRAADNAATRVEDVAHAMALESGKAIRDSLLEVGRPADLSGMGREGPKASIRDMTAERLFVLN